MFVILGQDGVARVERGVVRPEDVPAPAPEAEEEPGDAPASDEEGRDVEAPAEAEADELVGDAAAPLPDRLVLDLTAHRTAALRDALGAAPTVALAAVAHALVLAAFYPAWSRPTCLEIKATSAPLQGHAEGIEDSPAARRVAERHARWASRLPPEADDAWAFLCGLPGSELLDLLAHAASLTLNAVHVPWDRRPGAWAHADRLAEAVGLDMRACWAPTVTSYLGRVTKARIAEAVREAVFPEAAERIGGLKKPDMAAEAEALLAGTGWLPPLLRGPEAVAAEAEPVADAAVLAAE